MGPSCLFFFVCSICMALYSVHVGSMFDEIFLFTKGKEITILVYIKCLKYCFLRFLMGK